MYKNKVKEIRLQKGLSQTQACCNVGLANSTWSNIESGRWKPWPKARRDIARALQVMEEELFPTDLEK